MTLQARSATNGAATGSGCAAVVVAGGYGRRLAPITGVLPKVLVPVGDRALLDHLLDQIGRAGITEVHLLLGHHADLVCAYVQTHHGGLDLRLHRATQGLGTAGPLRVVASPHDDWLVINGDVLTDAPLCEVVAGHRASGADLTMCTAECAVRLPYAVVDVDEKSTVYGLHEKPTQRFRVNAGVYVLGPRARAAAGGSGALDMTDLVQRCLDAGLRVRGHALDPASWYDLGSEAGYRAALAATARRPDPGEAAG